MPSNPLSSPGQVEVNEDSVEHYRRLGNGAHALADHANYLLIFIQNKIIESIRWAYDKAQSECFLTDINCYFDDQRYFRADDRDIFNAEITRIGVDLGEVGRFIRVTARLDQNSETMQDKLTEVIGSAEKIEGVVRQRLTQWNRTL